MEIHVTLSDKPGVCRFYNNIYAVQTDMIKGQKISCLKMKGGERVRSADYIPLELLYEDAHYGTIYCQLIKDEIYT